MLLQPTMLTALHMASDPVFVCADVHLLPRVVLHQSSVDVHGSFFAHVNMCWTCVCTPRIMAQI